jgi:AAT family amino acid transporter
MVIGLMSFHEDARMALVVGPILLGLYLLLYFVLGLGKKEKLQLGEQK